MIWWSAHNNDQTFVIWQNCTPQKSHAQPNHIHGCYTWKRNHIETLHITNTRSSSRKPYFYYMANRSAHHSAWMLWRAADLGLRVSYKWRRIICYRASVLQSHCFADANVECVWCTIYTFYRVLYFALYVCVFNKIRIKRKNGKTQIF